MSIWTKDIVDRLRKHVNDRGGPSIDNGAWMMMLEAADIIEMLRRENLHSCPHCGYHGQPSSGSNQVKGWGPAK
jgi:hypothetical protein